MLSTVSSDRNLLVLASTDLTISFKCFCNDTASSDLKHPVRDSYSRVHSASPMVWSRTVARFGHSPDLKCAQEQTDASSPPPCLPSLSPSRASCPNQSTEVGYPHPAPPNGLFVFNSTFLRMNHPHRSSSLTVRTFEAPLPGSIQGYQRN